VEKGMFGGEKSEKNRDARRRRPWTIVAWTLFWVALAVGVVYLLSPYLFGALFGDREPETLKVENRTDETLLLYQVYVDGSEHPLDGIAPPVPPLATVDVGLPCGASHLVARTEEGSLVARRGPFEECNSEKWVIEAGSG
jgi:hypothetical protein